MVGYNLTEDQKRVLRQLVRGRKEGKIPRAFYAAGFGHGWSLVDWKGDDRPELELMDLQVLEEEGFLSLRVTAYTKRGSPSTVECILREKAFQAVRTDFAPPAPEVPSQINIGAYIRTVSGESVQGVGLAEDATISQVVNDPDWLRSKVEDLTERLLEEVKSELAGDDFQEYAQAAQNFKEQLLVEKPAPFLIKRLTARLALLSDIEGTIGLMVRVWTYPYPLLLIAAERVANRLGI